MAERVLGFRTPDACMAHLSSPHWADYSHRALHSVQDRDGFLSASGCIDCLLGMAGPFRYRVRPNWMHFRLSLSLSAVEALVDRAEQL